MKIYPGDAKGLATALQIPDSPHGVAPPPFIYYYFAAVAKQFIIIYYWLIKWKQGVTNLIHPISDNLSSIAHLDALLTKRRNETRSDSGEPRKDGEKIWGTWGYTQTNLTNNQACNTARKFSGPVI